MIISSKLYLKVGSNSISEGDSAIEIFDISDISNITHYYTFIPAEVENINSFSSNGDYFYIGSNSGVYAYNKTSIVIDKDPELLAKYETEDPIIHIKQDEYQNNFYFLESNYGIKYLSFNGENFTLLWNYKVDSSDYIFDFGIGYSRILLLYEQSVDVVYYTINPDNISGYDDIKTFEIDLGAGHNFKDINVRI